MKKWICLLLICLCFIAPAYSQNEDQTLIFTVELQKSKLKPGEEITFDLVWTNSSVNEISLFTPENIHKNWSSEWTISLTLTKPNGEQILLQPAQFSSIIYTAEQRHFKLLKPGESIRMPCKFRVREKIPFTILNTVPYILPDVEGDWVALQDLPPNTGAGMTIEEIRKAYNVQGGFYSGNQGLREILIIQDLLTDIFNFYGSYDLSFTYKNMNKTTFGPDMKTNQWKTIKVPEAWTGTLAFYTTLDIEKE